MSSPLVVAPQRQLSVIDQAIADIKDLPFYLGGHDLLNHVQWDRTSDGTDVLIKRRAADAEDDPGEEALPEWVGQVDAGDFWLYACGGWSGKLGPFGKTKAKAVMLPGTQYMSLAKLWPSLLNNLTTLQKQSCEGTWVNTGNYLLLAPNEKGIRIRHCVFEEVTDDDSGHESDVREDEVLAEDGDVSLGESVVQVLPDNDAFALENLKCRFPQGQVALTALIAAKTHRARNLPAYGVDGKLVSPGMYKSALQGAFC
ncbi:hypothetical protein B0H21DRAFT_827723 [Amylocystis lapponica]|nr:hypothetical protein B0H21DRAFT_827723 [Amylocystis lapponica]